MTQTCAAFTQVNQPCTNHITGASEVCSEHENFYIPEVWFKQYPLSNSTKYQYWYMNLDLMAVYRKAILEGRVIITQEHMKDLEASPRDASLVDYYLFCCQQPDVDPMWSPKLFSRAITDAMNAHYPRVFDMTLENHHFLLRHLEPIFNSSVRSFTYIVYNVLYYVVMLEIKNSSGKSSAARNLDNEEVSLLHYIETHPKFPDLLWEQSDKEEKLCTLMKSRTAIKDSCHEKISLFLERLSILRVKQRELQAEKMSGIRDELLNCAFHPSMILDVYEYKDLTSRWSDLELV